MKASTFSTSKYLSAADFGDTPVVWTIARVSTAVIGRTDPAERPTLQLREASGAVEPKVLVLNTGNLRRLAQALGDDMDQWAGAPVKIWSEWTDFRGERVRGIRCAAAVTAVDSGGGGGGGGAVPLRRRDELDDEIPF